MSLERPVSEAHRRRIIAAATHLLAEGGREALSTRAVSDAAGVQPPVIYRLFGDKRGLLDAVMTEGLNAYIEGKAKQEAAADPVDDLRSGWDQHVEFGLANPALYTLIYGDLWPGAPPPAALAGFEMLAAKIRRIAEIGQLRVDEERAAHLIHAAGSGVTLALIAMPEDQRDMAISELGREAVIAAITTDDSVAAELGPVGAAVTLHAVLPQTSALTPREKALLQEWLTRISRGDQGLTDL